jgi:uncharacterized damage-inducible protein DinB
MIPEVRAYHDSITTRLSQICDALDGMSAEQLNRRPVPNGNSAWVLATHTLGNARAWALGIACGQPVGRDRPAEFASAGSDTAAFRAETEGFIAQMAVALQVLTAQDLERRLVPSKELWGENEPHEISVRYALLQVIEHASLHLGHLHVTRDLALAG